MVDLQVIEIRDVLPITQVVYASSEIPSLTITGQDFTNAQEVYINETLSPDVVIVSSKQILAQIPETQTASPIRNIVIVSGRLTKTKRSKITFRMGDNLESLSGIEKLVQSFLKIMLQTPGTDIFSPTIGGGLLHTSGRQITNPSSSSMVSDLTLAVNKAAQQIISLQTRNPRLPLSERLSSAYVLSAKFNPNTLSLIGKIAIQSQSGNSSVADLEL